MKILSLLFGLFLLPLTLFGGYTYVNGRWSPQAYAPGHSVQEHYDTGSQELHNKNWDNALNNFMAVVYHFKGSPFYQDALFYAAVCLFNKKEYDLADKQFDLYVESGGKLKHFEKVFDYKLQIADKFAHGTKKHIFGLTKFPKWAPAKKNAAALYDEIVAALPGRDVAAQALYNKSDLLRKRRHYDDSIEALQTLSRRFPKHSLAAESYLRISEIYLEQSRQVSQNPDLLALAQVNLQRFAKSFPSDERVDGARKNMIAMQEVFAQSLYDTGRFYEKKKKPTASVIYYEDTLRKFPTTQAAEKSKERLAQLKDKIGKTHQEAEKSKRLAQLKEKLENRT